MSKPFACISSNRCIVLIPGALSIVAVMRGLPVRAAPITPYFVVLRVELEARTAAVSGAWPRSQSRRGHWEPTKYSD
jgi:hypothetical protein